jgi:hypothetical protein
MRLAQPRVADRPRISRSQLRASIPEASLTGTVADQSSIIRSIQDNRGPGQIGNRLFYAIATTVTNLFDFSGHDLNETCGRTSIIGTNSGHANDEQW